MVVVWWLCGVGCLWFVGCVLVCACVLSGWTKPKLLRTIVHVSWFCGCSVEVACWLCPQWLCVCAKKNVVLVPVVFVGCVLCVRLVASVVCCWLNVVCCCSVARCVCCVVVLLP